MKFAISVHSLRKTYPRSWASAPFEALKGISLDIEAGEVFGFIGQNGAGKSTAIKVLIGAIRATSGSASLFDIAVANPLARKGVGYVPENTNLPDYLTPFEILSMGLKMNRCGVGNPRQHCMVWLERFGLANVANKVVKGFSKGMAQRTVLAHALVAKPRLLILDEPLSGLDPIGRRDVVEILAEYRQLGGTIFLTSHVLHDVERLADRFGLIHQGELLTIRSPQELAADQAGRYLLSYRGGVAIDGSTEVRPGLYLIELPATEIAIGVRRVLEASCVVQDLRPKATLESVFFSTIAGGRTSG